MLHNGRNVGAFSYQGGFKTGSASGGSFRSNQRVAKPVDDGLPKSFAKPKEKEKPPTFLVEPKKEEPDTQKHECSFTIPELSVIYSLAKL